MTAGQNREAATVLATLAAVNRWLAEIENAIARLREQTGDHEAQIVRACQPRSNSSPNWCR